MSTRKKAPQSKSPKAAPKAPTKATPKPTAPSPKAGDLCLDDLKGLIALVAKEAFQEFEFEAGTMKFRIRKDSPNAAPQVTYAPPVAAPVGFGTPIAHVVAAPAAPAPAAPAAPVEEVGLHYITSPIVGTFYRANNPTAASFVNPGDKVRPGQTLCIVEAMKLMNEIESDIAGEIVKVLVENGQPVEYGERLFAVRVG